MALTGSESADGPPSAFGRVRAWLDDPSDHSLAQRLAGTAFLIRVGSAALAYVSQVLFARWMGTFEFGIYVYVWTWVLLVGALVDFGVASSVQRFVPEYNERNEPALLRGFLAGSRLITSGGAAAAMLLGIVATRLLTPWLDTYLVVPLYLACASLPLYAMNHLQDGVARSYNWVNLALLPQFIVRQIVLLALMAGAYAIGERMNAVVAMVASVLSLAVITVGQGWVLRRRLRKIVTAGPARYEMRTWLATSLPLLLVDGFYLLLTYADVLVLQQFRSPDEVGVYYAAAKTLTLVAFIYFSVSATVAHKFTTFHVAGDRERLQAFVAQSIKWTFWPSLVATVLILAGGKPLLWLFGPEFTQGYSLMFLLAVGLLARAAIGPIERLLSMLGEQRACATVYAVAFLINLTLCVALIPRFGGAGAAIATSTALVIESILLFLVTKRRLGFHVFVWGGRKSEPCTRP